MFFGASLALGARGGNSRMMVISAESNESAIGIIGSGWT